MKKNGIIKTYKLFPVDSLSYKLQELNSIKTKVDTSIMRLAAFPIRTYVYYKVVDTYLSPGFFILFVTADTISIILDAIKLSKNSKELKELRKNIVEHLSKVEPKVLTDENAKEQLQKRI